MNLTLSELLQSCLATPVFLLLFVPAGFVLAWSTNVLAFRSRSAIEQLLWSVSLSLPLCLVIANIPGRYLPAYLVLSIFLLLDAAAIVLLIQAQRKRRIRPTWSLDRYAKLVLLILLAEVLYVWLAGLPIRFHHAIYEPVFSSDWEIRLPLVQAAVRGGVPPHNPFFTFRGESPPMRYYFYWFTLCAQVARLVHTDARSTLLASSIYAGFAIVATLFLYSKYMVRSSAPLRQRCLLVLGLCCVLGLDVIPNIIGLFVWHLRLQPEIEWWSPDRSPSLQGALIYAPHHVAGAVCGLVGFLLFSLLGTSGETRTRRAAIIHGVLGGIAFAALVGTSTFIVLFFGLACVVLFIERVRRKEFFAPAALVIAGILSIAVSVPYLHDLVAKTASAGANGPHQHFLSLKLRHNNFGHQIVRWAGKVAHHPGELGPVRFVYRAAVVPWIYLCEFGFYLFVLVFQFRRDFLHGPMSSVTRALWILTGSVGFFFLVVSSAPIQYVNDLGVHAGLLLRLIFALWGSQMLAWYLAQRKVRVWSPRERWVIRVAALFLVLGVSMSIWQAVVERAYLALVDHQVVPASDPFPRARHVASIYGDIYDAQKTVAQSLPTDAVIQSNPVSRFQTIFRLYQQRRQAAGDASCEGNFGGDPQLCKGMMQGIYNLFGTQPVWRPGGTVVHLDPAGMTLDAFNSLCEQDGLAAVLASRFDPAWYVSRSWVWRGSLMYSNRTVRVIRCPAA